MYLDIKARAHCRMFFLPGSCQYFVVAMCDSVSLSVIIGRIIKQKRLLWPYEGLILSAPRHVWKVLS